MKLDRASRVLQAAARGGGAQGDQGLWPRLQGRREPRATWGGTEELRKDGESGSGQQETAGDSRVGAVQSQRRYRAPVRFRIIAMTEL